MARTVDPERHRARRLQILDAAVTCFARHGYDRTTTARIARTAGIGSGTLFHYFPTKQAILVAVLEEDTRELTEFFAGRGSGDAWEGLLAFVDRTVAEAADARVPGFVNAVMVQAAQPELASALADNDRVVRTGLRGLVERAQRDGPVRTDRSADQLASWLVLLTDGFYSRVATEDGFDPTREGGLLRETVEHLVSGPAGQPAPLPP
jgi:AcrR family transcriptional regulator